MRCARISSLDPRVIPRPVLQLNAPPPSLHPWASVLNRHRRYDAASQQPPSSFASSSSSLCLLSRTNSVIVGVFGLESLPAQHFSLSPGHFVVSNMLLFQAHQTSNGPPLSAPPRSAGQKPHSTPPPTYECCVSLVKLHFSISSMQPHTHTCASTIEPVTTHIRLQAQRLACTDH